MHSCKRGVAKWTDDVGAALRSAEKRESLFDAFLNTSETLPSERPPFETAFQFL